MSTLRFQCPECGSTFISKNADSTEGKKVRCPKCAAVFRVESADPEADLPRRTDERPSRRQRPTEDDREDDRRAASRRRADEDERNRAPARKSREDDDDRPSSRKRRDEERRRGKKKSESKGLFSARNIIILSVFTVVAIGGVIFLDRRASRSDEAKNDKPPDTEAQVPTPFVAVGPNQFVPPVGGRPLRGQLPPVEEVEKMVPREPHVPISALDPKNAAKSDEDDPTPLAKDLDAETVERVKRATVYIRVHQADDRDASGTGFFEATSGLVMTNAHVIDMLHDGEPPKRIEVILHSGEGNKKELVLVADVVAVDRESDVAVLRPRMQGVNGSAPQGLTIAPSARVKLLQPVFVFGFPLGEGLGKDITASATSVSSLRRDRDGNLGQIQVNGGMHSGNSGGPVVNTKGQVIGVAVAVIRGTQINFAIPGDRVQDLLRGRMDQLQVREEKPRGNDIPIKIGLRSSDPLDRIAKSGVDWWIGSAELEVPPSLASGMKLPGNLTKQTLTLNYQGNGRMSEGEIVLSPPPLAGQVVWMQPWTINRFGLAVYAAGMKHAVDAPPAAQPVTLKYAPPAGRQPLEITSKASFRLAGILGEDRSLRLNLTSKLHEEAGERRPTGTTVTHFEVEKIDVAISFDERQAPPSPMIQRVTQFMSAAALTLEADARGGHVSSRVNVEKVPAESKESIERFGDQLQKSLQVMMVSLPTEEIKPGHTWLARSVVPGTGLTVFESVTMEMKFKYLGIRPSTNGKNVAVIEVNDSQDGTQARGKILVDVATGRVMQGRFAIATALQLPLEGDVMQAHGVIEIQLTRLRD